MPVVAADETGLIDAMDAASREFGTVTQRHRWGILSLKARWNGRRREHRALEPRQHCLPGLVGRLARLFGAELPGRSLKRGTLVNGQHLGMPSIHAVAFRAAGRRQ
jgi:hypothetical protein